MFGLFLVTHDYTESYDLVCVSLWKEKLVEKCKGKAEPLLSGDKQEKARNNQTCHYVIQEIEVL